MSILEVLKAPTRSDLVRKRKIDSNPPPKGRRRARGEGSSELKSVGPRHLEAEFPNECLTATEKGENKLFCNACREELRGRVQTIKKITSK